MNSTVKGPGSEMGHFLPRKRKINHLTVNILIDSAIAFSPQLKKRSEQLKYQKILNELGRKHMIQFVFQGGIHPTKFGVWDDRTFTIVETMQKGLRRYHPGCLGPHDKIL